MGVVRGVTGCLPVMKNKKKQKRQVDTADLSGRTDLQQKDLKTYSRGNLTINGQEATEEQRVFCTLQSCRELGRNEIWMMQTKLLQR